MIGSAFRALLSRRRTDRQPHWAQGRSLNCGWASVALTLSRVGFGRRRLREDFAIPLAELPIELYPTVGAKGEETGVEEPMQVCPESDPVERHIVLAVGRRDEMRGLESLDRGLARQDATIGIALKNHRAEPGLALGPEIRCTRSFATGSEVETLPKSPQSRRRRPDATRSFRSPGPV